MEPQNFSWAPEDLFKEDFRKITQTEDLIKQAVKAADQSKMSSKKLKIKRTEI